MSVLKHEKRLITGAVLLGLLSAALYCGGWGLRGLILASSLLAVYEFLSMFWPGPYFRFRKALGLLFTAAVVAAPAFGPEWLVISLCLMFLSLALTFLFAYGVWNADVRFGHYAPIMHAVLYIPLVLQLAMHLPVSEQCLVIAAAVASDTGGYYAGMFLGRRRIWPSISPKKTWAGSFGGLLLCTGVCTAIAVGAAHWGWPLPALPLWGWACLGVSLNLAAQLGDFFESALKRTLDVKDSSDFLPGHGGMLDRLDSLLFVLPVYMLLRMLLTLSPDFWMHLRQLVQSAPAVG